MNKRRRTSLNSILDDLDKLKTPINKTSAIELIDRAQVNLRKVADEEEDALDNRPESFRWSTANDDMNENVSDLNEAADNLEEMVSNCQDMDVFDYELIKGDVIKTVNTIKRTIHR